MTNTKGNEAGLPGMLRNASEPFTLYFTGERHFERYRPGGVVETARKHPELFNKEIRDIHFDFIPKHFDEFEDVYLNLLRKYYSVKYS